jgi:hypothetical protein
MGGPRITAQSIMLRVKKLSNGCWDFTGLAKSGTSNKGQIRYLHRLHSASHIFWVLLKGPIPEGLQPNHSCSTLNCCNPDHMYLGTQQQNVLDRPGWSNPKPVKIYCPRGHKYDRSTGRMVCNICHAKKQAAYLERKKMKIDFRKLEG